MFLCVNSKIIVFLSVNKCKTIFTTLANPNTYWRTQRYFYFIYLYKKEQTKKKHMSNIFVPSLAGQYPPGSLAEKQDDSTEIVFRPFCFFVITPAVLPGAISADPKKETKAKQTHQTGYILLDPQPRLPGLVRVCSDWLCLFLRAESPGSSDLVWAPETADKGTREHRSRLLETQHWLTEEKKNHTYELVSEIASLL